MWLYSVPEWFPPLRFVLIANVLNTMFSNALGILGVCAFFNMQMIYWCWQHGVRMISWSLNWFFTSSNVCPGYHQFLHNVLILNQTGSVPWCGSCAHPHCLTSLLPLTYLGILISGRIPRRQDWKQLISKTWSHLPSWKSKFLSLGARLTLMNSILSAVPNLLPQWVIKKIKLDLKRLPLVWSRHWTSELSPRQLKTFVQVKRSGGLRHSWSQGPQ